MEKPVGLILAAGLGNRLRPSTLFCPKPLIPVAGIEPLYFSLYQFSLLGIERVIVNVHYLHSMIFKAIEEWRMHFPNLEIRISNESSELLGTGGALLKVVYENEDFFDGRGLIVQNGDTIGLYDRGELYANPLQNSFAISRDPIFLKQYGPLWLSKDKGTWVGIGRVPKSPEWEAAHFLGCHYLSPAALSLLPKLCGEIRQVDLFNGIYRPLSDVGVLFEAKAFSFEDASSPHCWFDITNKEYLLSAQHEIMLRMEQWGWTQLLQKRYPGILELQKGVWILNEAGLDLKDVIWGAPSIFVNRSNQQGIMPSLNLGPQSCWIQEKSSEDLIRAGMSSRNSIVFLKKEAKSDVPHTLDGDVLLA